MIKRLNKRLIFVLLLLLGLTARQLAREHRPSLLRPGLRMYAYVANSGSGSVSVVDIIGLKVIATIPVGAGPSGLRAHPSRREIWGVSTGTGQLWVIDVPSGGVVARIPVGNSPFALDFSPDGKRAYVAASGSNSVVAVDCEKRQIVARATV
ncbi:MAG: YncE family protein, partial [Acidobacteria bacterium]|nr:YncE family protein [Acidobacteriota bacterium]